MQRLIQLVIIAFMTFASTQAFAGPAEDGAAAIDRWNAAYNANDLDALMKAYAPDAILQGSSEPQINVGTADLRKYFRNLPKGGSSNTIHERRMFVINDTTVLGSAPIPSKAGRRASRSWWSSAATTG